MFQRIVVKSLLVQQQDYPVLMLEGMAIRPEPIAILKLVVGPFFRFEISIKPDADGQVGFEVYHVVGGALDIAMTGRCDEGSLPPVRRHLHKTVRARLKKLKDEDEFIAICKKEIASTNKYNARSCPSRRQRRPVQRRTVHELTIA